VKLSQAVATLKTAKNSAHSQVTNIYHRLQRTGEFVGQVKVYTPTVEGGETRPDDVQIVQARSKELLRDTASALAKQFDYQANVDYGNTVAKADVIIGGNAVIKDAPVPYLLFLEKQLKDWIAVLNKLPVLDPAKQWIWDADREEFFTEKVSQLSQKKVQSAEIVVQPTDRHPAQWRERTDDVTVGKWDTVYRSGAMHRKDIRALLERANELAEAVKIAREEANSTTIESKRGVGARVFSYLLLADK
jgi:hypothetical protein